MDTDVFVAGGGPAGSTLAALLAQKGLRVTLAEKEKFPRFKIGESLLPYSLDILRKSGALKRIDSGKYIRKYGAQFIHHQEEEQVYFNFSDGLDDQHPYAFEVQRSEFDKDLLDHARDCGVEILQPFSICEIKETKDSVEIQSDEKVLKTSFFVDATGRSSLVGRQNKMRQKNPLFNHIAVFSHYKNIDRSFHRREGDIIIGILPEGSWSWHIPLLGETTSVGIVCHSDIFRKNKDNENFIEESLQCHPSFKSMMRKAERVRPIEVASNYSFANKEMMGARWLSVGDAASFLDPVFSSGVHIALQSANLASDCILQAFQKDQNLKSYKESYESQLRLGIQRFENLLQIFYRTDFTDNCRKLEKRPQAYQAMTSAVAGDMWNDNNPLFRFNIMETLLKNEKDLSL